ncbi:MAG: ClbS/DfsB family four-helix bundle protein [Anaerolineae bacterium]|nr:ClbS/DfsB family four-helix bundle protein [Anaerolineae bacterium]
MPKAEVIADVRAARAALVGALDGLPEEQMLRVGAVGVWSIKDMLAHLVAWEAELVTALSQLEQHKQRPPRIVEIEDIDAWNEQQYHAHAARPLAAVLEDFHGVHKQLIRALNELDNRALDDNRLWPWMEGEPLSYLVAENAIWHEEEHAEDVKAWRDSENV